MRAEVPLILLAAISLGPAATASPASTQGVTLVNTQVRTFHSERVGVDYKLYIGLPREYQGKPDTYPVVIVLDADYFFSMVHSTAGILADHDELSPTILVGLAYPGVAEEKHGPIYKANRTRDYTISRVLEGGYGPEFQKLSGGADRFLDFLAEDLLPYLDREFRTRPGDRALVGCSYGGLLASYALLTRPGLFQRFVIVSPSLWWDHHLISRLEEKAAAARKDLVARAFFGVGAREAPPNGETDMVSDLTAFVETLRSRRYPSLQVDLWVAPDETHHSVFPAAAMRGIQYVFSKKP
jgi:uncharacterized protein